ncbi:MAG: dihydropteroate synthase [Solirubrobacterales bacterium]
MHKATTHALAARDHRLELSGAPLVMGILNATPDSFSDPGDGEDLEGRVRRGQRLLRDGADLLDVGGESGVTNRPPIEPREEIERVAPLVERLAGHGAVLSVDTYKPAVAQVAVEAGAAIVNDPSGLVDPEVADVCASSGAALVVTHTRARPKQKLVRPAYDDVVDDVKRLLTERLEVARAAGVADERLLVCPGPDLGKDPAQTIELLRRLDELHALGLPILLAVSRKDFVGALTGRPPRERLAGTLAAVAHGLDRGAHCLRVHDVAATRDFLAVRDALRGHVAVPDDLLLAEDLRREPLPQEEVGPSPKEAAA